MIRPTLWTLAALTLCACMEVGNGGPPQGPLPVVYPDANDAPSGDTDNPRQAPVTLPPLPASNSTYGWSIPATAPTRNSDCPVGDTTIYGPSYVWRGFTYQGKTYTCNTCTGGVEAIQGDWRAVFDIDDPTLPYELDATYRELLTFKGNAFINILSGIDLGQPVTATLTGWYFCSTHPETGNNIKFFVLTGVEPEGAFAWQTGMVFTGDLLMNGKNALLWGWFDGVVTQNGPGWSGTAPYCRVGTMVGPHACENPF